MSERPELAESIIGTDLSYNNKGAANGLEVVREIWPGMQTARIMGSAALGLSYAAAGRTDLYFHHQLEPWDQVAGLLLVEEAGGVVTDRMGRRAGLYSDGNRGVEPDSALRVHATHRRHGLARVYEGGRLDSGLWLAECQERLLRLGNERRRESLG